MTIRTRFAPSPTGYLHIGGARTALFSWAYARKLGGTFILRIEDTDLERSTQESVQAILDGMSWLNLDYDEGPFYQMQRMDRYKAVIQQMLEEGTAYCCYTSVEELESMRETQRARGEKPRYNGRWRPELGKVLPVPPEGIKPVVRFKNPLHGVTSWDDMVKGRIMFENSELDDLIIARADGTPTYNFCAVVGSNPSEFSNCGDNCPVENVSWNDAQVFIQKLNTKTGKQYQLPSGAEWEYACYGGSQSEYCGGNNLDALGWADSPFTGKTHPAGQKQANGYGLYDMSGNVWEWTNECYNGNCEQRVLRGGSWKNEPQDARVARRIRGGPAYRGSIFGFRLARMLQ